MKTADFDYELPRELIAQAPPAERTAARMLVLHCARGRCEHRRVAALPEYLGAGDLLVLNNTRVFPARLYGFRADTGGRVEVLLIEQVAAESWEALYRAARPPRPGLELSLGGGALSARVVSAAGQGRVRLDLDRTGPELLETLERVGVPPLPPYIRRQSPRDSRTPGDRERYQTVYASRTGAVAAPTAGLHFSDALLAQLERNGVHRAELTLHVGPGTFKPVTSEDVSGHAMESERYAIGRDAAETVNRTRASGGRVVAVGTTTVRALESAAGDDGRIRAGGGRATLFIYPPYRFRAVDALLTNFHLPRSTLLMLVSAFVGHRGGQGRELLLRVYAEAVRHRYRFYSYGDCMLLL